MIGNLYIDGVNSADFGVFVTEAGIYNAPYRIFQSYRVPGRNGDLFYDTGSYSNVTIRYPCVIYKDFNKRIKDWQNFVLSKSGYCRIVDSFEPEEYRLGVFSGEFDIKKSDRTIGIFDMEFNCKPQRYWRSGDREINVVSGEVIFNPTSQEAKPIIKVYGYGTLSIGSETITINNYSEEYVIIDCEMQDCYREGVNLNRYVTLSSKKFPVLKSGLNGISYSGNITRVVITPRWWEL